MRSNSLASTIPNQGFKGSKVLSFHGLHINGNPNDILIRTGFIRLIREVRVNQKDRRRINLATMSVRERSMDLDAIVTPRRPIPKLNIKVCISASLFLDLDLPSLSP